MRTPFQNPGAIAAFLLLVLGLCEANHANAEKATPAPPANHKAQVSIEDTTNKSVAPTAPKTEKIECEKLPQKKTSDLWELSQCHYKQASLEKAIDVLREMTRKDPKELDAYFTCSWLLWTLSQSKSGDITRSLQEESLAELNRAVEMNSTHWEPYVERGDFYFLRLNQVTKAYAEYMKARSLYDGDFARKVLPADVGRKASIEARIARSAEKLDRKGEAVEASCRALFFDPDDKGAQARIERLHGSCTRKKVKDPRTKEDKGSN